MTLQQVTVIGCIALFAFMLVVPVWIVRSYRKAVRQPSGKWLVSLFIVAAEAVFLAGIIHLVADVFWSENDMPLVWPCLGIALIFGGAPVMIWTGRKLYYLERRG